MIRKIMTITYTCPEDKANLGETDIMGFALQKLGELGAYDINMKASTSTLMEPKTKNLEIRLPEFMQPGPRAVSKPYACLELIGRQGVHG